MFFTIIMAVLLIDQGTKALIRMLMFQGESIPVLPSIFHLTYIMNPGAAFGILPNQHALFITTGVLLILGVLIAYWRLPAEKRLLKVGLALMLGGSLGNLVDRVRFGTVVDFLDFRIWPVFNLADTAIIMGVFLLAWELLKDTSKSGEGSEG
ncbi:MAG: signal peptidase II [Peptococcaceae bacterium]|nr:signal peptidase II [Peptococcaceae bacterium]